MMNYTTAHRTWRQRALRIVAAVAMAVFVVCAAPAVARAATIEVNNVDELIQQIKLSREGSYSHKIILKNDIDFTQDEAKIDEIIKELGSLTFGSKDYPFQGEFDGDGHYIIGLNYKRSLWKPAPNTGLFSFTKNAFIHDIHFRDCYIGADFRGGVLVGQADHTRIESVRMVDCTLSVTPANNAVSLITNAGLMGGMIAGEMVNGSHMYDCTVQGGRVVNNSVIGVSGVGGEGLYLGALVGSAEDSEIEYSRVLPNERYYADRIANPKVSVYDRDENGDYKYQTEVYNCYEVAVGALAGQGVYVGGIVGYTNDVDVVDCFSTAWLHTYAANYVSVGSGNIGYVGGIIAHSKSSKKGANASRVIRCHYAGNMESFQWNAVAVIPIVQSNVYLAGLVERDWEEDTHLENAYFKRNDIVGRKSAIKPHPKGFVRSLGDWLGLNHSDGRSVEGFGYGPIVDDAKYADRLFWEGENYDFEGDELRYSTIDNQGKGHINKWVMDDLLGIPVHGSSVKATLDFPGAGSVTIEPTSMGKAQVTSDPYNFAVQAVSANETDLTVKATTVQRGDTGENGKSLTPDVSDERNGAYRFGGWFRQPDVTTNHIKKNDHTFFEPIVPAEPQAEQVSTDATYTAHNKGTGGATAEGFRDNDLFVAYHQAQVLFHDVKGNVINKETSAVENKPILDDDWYNHQDALPAPAAPATDRKAEGGIVEDGAKLLGWTTMRNDAAGEAGWKDVQHSELNDMKAAGAFYEGGEPIERPMDLYPVYASYGSNIILVAEGHELDATSDDLNVREGVLKAESEAKDGKYTLTVRGINSDGSPMDKGVLPDGYRFVGWYEIEKNKDGKPVYTEVPGVVVDSTGKTATARRYEFGRNLSDDLTVTIPDNVDLTQEHYYYARFEYRVDYYAAAHLRSQVPGWNDTENPRKFTELWKPYCSAFDDLGGPKFNEEYVDHWSFNKIKGHQDGDDVAPLLAQGVVSHYALYGHNKTDDRPLDFNIVVSPDFPNSADVSTHGRPGAVLGSEKFKVAATLKETYPNGFEFAGWSWQAADRGGIEKKDNPWTTGSHLSGRKYAYEAHLVAHVTFVDGADSGNLVVNRAYSDSDDDKKLGFVNGYQKVLMDQNLKYEFRYANYPGGKKSERLTGLYAQTNAAPSDAYMQGKKQGKLFLGWLDKNEIIAGSMTQGEYDRLYDEGTRMSKVPLDVIKPYLIQRDALCERPMELWPVYLDYSYETTTNITRDTALTDPADPQVVSEVRGEQGKLTLTVDADVDAKTAEDYELVSWTIEAPEGTVIDTITEVGGKPVSNANARLSYDIIAGTKHVIVANYRVNPNAKLDVVYHVRPAGGDKPTVTVEKTAGDFLGKGPVAEFAPANAVMVAWSEERPAAGQEFLTFDKADAAKMVDEYTVVERNMELWPVYRTVNIGGEDDKADVRVNSNIDAEIKRTDHRYAEVKTEEQSKQTYVSLVAKPVDGYQFLGWYTNFKQVNADGTVDGTPVLNNRVTGDDIFAGNLYTAVYVKGQMYSVVFHFPDGQSKTLEIEEKNPTKFVEEQEVQEPKLDENGKPVYDKDGKPVMVTVKKKVMVVGAEETGALQRSLDQANAKGEYRELFGEWEWKQADGDLIPWNSFCDAGIVAQMKNEGATKMDLYPVTYRLSARDAEDKHYKSSNLVWDIDPAVLTSADAPAGKPAVKIAFGPDVLYVGDRLTIHMDRINYSKGAATDAAAKTPIDGKTVSLYQTFDFTSVKPIDTKVTGHLGKGHEGDAEFKFKTTGSLVIEKTAPKSAAGSTFTFLVTEVNADGSPKADAKSATVTLTADAALGADSATARETLTVPWGYYKVVETTWGWRYTPSYRFTENGLVIQGRPANVLLVRGDGNAKVTNTEVKDKYFDGEDRSKNVFGEGRVDPTGGER